MVFVLVFVVLLGAAPPPAGKATELAKRKEWDELLLTFATVRPGTLSAHDSATVAQALTQGCLGLEKSDAVMALDLGQHARELGGPAEACLCEARAAQRLGQRGTAETALRAGLSAFPKNPRLLLALARELADQNDTQGATELLAKVPSRAAQGREAKRLLIQLRSQARQESAALSHAARAESLTVGTAPAYGSSAGPGDLRNRDSQYFHFKYFKNGRDFGQRAELEGQVAATLEDARRHSASLLGVSRESPVEVVLYTREEFILHFGPAIARSAAGFYRDGAIRVNGGIELTDEHRATLAHEYIHALIDELAQHRPDRVPIWLNEGLAEYAEWRFQGQDGPALAQRARLRALAQRNALPSLASMSKHALLATADPVLGYAYSGVAARFLVQQAGSTACITAIQELGRGEPLDTVFQSRLGRSVDDLERGLSADLISQ